MGAESGCEGIYDGTVRANLASLVEQFRQNADDTAVVDHRGIRRYRTTYGELARLCGRFAAELDRRGLVPGDRVVLWGANSAEWMAAFFGCLLRGAIAVPLDAAGSPEFAAKVIKDVSAKLVVGDRMLLPGLAGPDLPPQIRLSELDAQLPVEPNFAVSEAVTAQSPLQIIFTSGTTSEPKGIVHTHANVLASVLPIEREIGKFLKYERWVHPLRFLHTLPLSHVFGQFMALWLPPLLSGELHFADQLEARRMTEMIRRERISVLVAVPRVVQLLRTHLLRRFPGLDEELAHPPHLTKYTRWWHFRNVHNALGWKFWAVISGGAALPHELEAFWNGIGIGLIQGYGMTETTALVTLNSPFKISQGSIGKTLPGREVRLSDDGEILVRGDMLASATWTNGALRPREGEWLATGDLAERDEKGDLRFLGRKGDMIVTSGGMNVHPDDLEAAMKKQSGVRDCAVVPCETVNGVEPVAVVLFPGTESQLQEAVLAANGGLADFQQIRRVLQWPEPQFPFTSTGKLLRRKVAEWARQELEERQQANRLPGPRYPSTKNTDVLLDQIAEVTGERPASSSDDLRLAEDLHLDSLGRVQLQTALEQSLGLELEDDAVAAAQTLGELRAILRQDPGAIASATQVPAATPGPRDPQATFQIPESAPSHPPGGELPTSQKPRSVSEESKAESQEALKQEAPKDDPRELTPEHLYPYWPWNWLFRSIRVVFLELVMRPLIWILALPRVVRQGGELPPGPLLIIANHLAAYDGALLLYALPGRLRRHMAIAMSGEMLLDYRRGRNLSNGFLNFFAPPQYWLVTALFNVFPLPRLHGFRRSFLHAGEAMDEGYSVMIFPEGARNFDGKLRSFRSGIGLLAQESRVPIVPAALVGLDEMHRSGWFRSGLLEIRIGEAIAVDDSVDPAQLAARLEVAVRKLLD